MDWVEDHHSNMDMELLRRDWRVNFIFSFSISLDVRQRRRLGFWLEWIQDASDRRRLVEAAACRLATSRIAVSQWLNTTILCTMTPG